MEKEFLIRYIDSCEYTIVEIVNKTSEFLGTNLIITKSGLCIITKEDHLEGVSLINFLLFGSIGKAAVFLSFTQCNSLLLTSAQTPNPIV